MGADSWSDAAATAHGPRVGLALLGTLNMDERMSHTHNPSRQRGSFLELEGD